MKKSVSLLCLFALALASSCTKEGTGGDATLVVRLKHHDVVVVSQENYPDSVFVKFDATELPGTSPADFDAVFIGNAGEDHVHVKGLKPGDYFLYGVGMDSMGPHRVTGGKAIKIKRREKDEEILVDLPVTE